MKWEARSKEKNPGNSRFRNPVSGSQLYECHEINAFHCSLRMIALFVSKREGGGNYESIVTLRITFNQTLIREPGRDDFSEQSVGVVDFILRSLKRVSVNVLIIESSIGYLAKCLLTFRPNRMESLCTNGVNVSILPKFEFTVERFYRSHKRAIKCETLRFVYTLQN